MSKTLFHITQDLSFYVTYHAQFYFSCDTLHIIWKLDFLSISHSISLFPWHVMHHIILNLSISWKKIFSCELFSSLLVDHTLFVIPMWHIMLLQFYILWQINFSHLMYHVDQKNTYLCLNQISTKFIDLWHIPWIQYLFPCNVSH